MSESRLVVESDGRFRLEGALDFDTVPRLLEQGEALLQGDGEIIVDLAGVTRANSAGLGLLLEWVGRASGNGGAIRFDSIPASLRNIAQLCNVTELLEPGSAR